MHFYGTFMGKAQFSKLNLDANLVQISLCPYLSSLNKYKNKHTHARPRGLSAVCFQKIGISVNPQCLSVLPGDPV